jgi:hypothetical protein
LYFERGNLGWVLRARRNPRCTGEIEPVILSLTMTERATRIGARNCRRRTHYTPKMIYMIEMIYSKMIIIENVNLSRGFLGRFITVSGK